jgi:hypothetical protein
VLLEFLTDSFHGGRLPSFSLVVYKLRILVWPMVNLVPSHFPYQDLPFFNDQKISMVIEEQSIVRRMQYIG